MGIFGQERAKMKVLILLLWTIMTIYTSQARYYLVKTATNGDHKMKLKHDDHGENSMMERRDDDHDDYVMFHEKTKLKHDDDGDYKMKLKHDDHDDYSMIHDKIKLKHDDDGDYKMKLKHDDHGDYQMRRKPDQDQDELNFMSMSV